MLVSQVLVPPAMRAILDAPNNKIEGFLAAGHVCTVMGYEEYEPIATQYRVPIVVTGFEPLDILEGVYLCVRQLEAGRAEVENQYSRSVRREGNRAAQEVMGEVFRVTPRHWRGVGDIAASGLGLAERYADFDAEHRFGPVTEDRDAGGECISGLVLRGERKPTDCPAFGTRCTPERAAAGVRLVTGDTKVVDRGKADGMFVNTAGIGRIRAPAPVGPASVRPNDVVILSGDIGRHGMAVMAAREGFGFETAIESDCTAVAAPVLALFEADIAVRCLRDLTRGGLASALVEICETAGLAMRFDEARVAVRADVTAARELLGLDPLYVANEGRFVAFVARQDADRALDVLHGFEITAGAVVIGEIRDGPAGEVSCRGPLGVARAIDMLSGEQLPRIC